MGTVPRVIAFILVGLVLLTAVGLFLTARVGTAPAPDSALAAAATSGVASTPASAATLPPSIVTSPVSLASAPVSVPAAAPSAAAAPASGPADQKACVRRADGAVICGAVASLGNNSAPNPFDGPVVTQPFAPPPSVAARKPVRVIHQTERRLPPPSKHASRQPPAPPPQIDRHPTSREAEKRPPLRHVASIDTRHLDRRPPPPRFDRDAPPRFSEPDRHRVEGDRQRIALRAPPPPGYEARLRKLEREIHALRDEALRKEALRRVERRDVVKRSYPQPPPGYRQRDTRYDAGPFGEPANRRRVDRDRQSVAD